MKPLLGFILIDPQEIIIRIYQSVEEDNWQILYQNNYPLTYKDAQIEETIKVLEVIANVFADVTGLGVGEWKIYMRDFDQIVIKEISEAISIKVEFLTPENEHNILFKDFLKKNKP